MTKIASMGSIAVCKICKKPFEQSTGAQEICGKPSCKREARNIRERRRKRRN